jgi:hypothetical protein
MPLTVVKTVNFGKTRSNLGTVGYTLFDNAGVEIASRSVLGVYEVGIMTGIYAASITFPDGFAGSILWDTGQGADAVYATEEQNFTDSASSLSGDITSIKSALDADLTFVKDMLGGRWRIDHENFQMIFYKHDNVTEVARFDLRDKNNDPSFLSVFHRNRVT